VCTPYLGTMVLLVIKRFRAGIDVFDL